jgi:hypothetical protein
LLAAPEHYPDESSPNHHWTHLTARRTLMQRELSLCSLMRMFAEHLKCAVPRCVSLGAMTASAPRFPAILGTRSDPSTTKCPPRLSSRSASDCHRFGNSPHMDCVAVAVCLDYERARLDSLDHRGTWAYSDEVNSSASTISFNRVFDNGIVRRLDDYFDLRAGFEPSWFHLRP